MKFFIAIALFAAVASARFLPADLNLSPAELAEVEQIMAAINSPSTDPTTATMLEQMLYEILGLAPVNIPAIIDEHQPIDISPIIIDKPQPIDISPEIVDFPVAVEDLPAAPIPATPIVPAAPVPSSSPLVQIIVNVNQEGSPVPSPVQIDNAHEGSPVVVVEEPQKPEIEGTPVHVVDAPEIIPTPVAVVEEAPAKPEPVLIGHLPEPVVVAPIIVAPAVVGPETLN